MRPAGTWLAVVFAAFLMAAPAQARGKSGRAGKAKSSKVAKVTPPILALSVGHPNDGKLVGARRFRETRHMKSLPAYATSQAKWALPELLELLDRASQSVAKRFPGSVLGVGELSGQNGGPISRHRSHQTGRDVDVGFYLLDKRGRSMRPIGLVDMNADGTSTVRSTTRFDEKRNWAFVAALLQDSRVEVTHIFVWAPLRARLLAYAEKIGAPRALRKKAAQVMSQPANVQRHADHFHIRIACPASLVAKGCVESVRRRPAPVVVAESAKKLGSGQQLVESLGVDDDEDMNDAPARREAPPEPKPAPALEPLPEPSVEPAPITRPAAEAPSEAATS